MVKLTAPCFSLGASGTIGKAVTFAAWKGRAYARERVVPANPQSDMQVSMRAMLKFVSQTWDAIGSTPKGSWADRAAASNISNFNAYVAANMRRWREFQAPSQTDPAAETGDQPTATLDSAVGGVRHMDLTFTITDKKDAWGVAIFRSPTGTFDTSVGNCIAVLLIDANGTLVWTDSNLDAGTYYYDARFFTKEGALGPEEGEVNGTAT